MEPALQEMLRRVETFPGQFHELRDGVRKAIDIADKDPEMALVRARKVLELVVREVFERRYRERAGTRPLENLLHRLTGDGHLPARLDPYANAVRLFGNVGTHRFGERWTCRDVQRCLEQLMAVLDWYVQEERPAADGVQPAKIPRERPPLPAEAAQPREETSDPEGGPRTAPFAPAKPNGPPAAQAPLVPAPSSPVAPGGHDRQPEAPPPRPPAAPESPVAAPTAPAPHEDLVHVLVARAASGQSEVPRPWTMSERACGIVALFIILGILVMGVILLGNALDHALKPVFGIASLAGCVSPLDAIAGCAFLGALNEKR